VTAKSSDVATSSSTAPAGESTLQWNSRYGN
jgi:hypothetical protein